MIQLHFELGAEHIVVEIKGINILFCNYGIQLQMSPIDGLKLNKGGVIKEFPDLKDNKEWHSIAIQRFKQHIKNLPSEKARAKYIVADLKKHGYQPKLFIQQGFRPRRIE